MRKFTIENSKLDLVVQITKYCEQHNVLCSMLQIDSEMRYYVELEQDAVDRLIKYYLADSNSTMLAFIAGQLNGVQ
jgi:hypothetical protein